MELSLLILAAIGVAAVIRRLLRAGYHAVRHSAYALYAREIAATRARRGDLTGLEEAREWVVHARRERLQALGVVCIWLLLLLLPRTLLVRSLPVYALYAALWLLPASWPGSPRAAEVKRPTHGRP